MENSYKIILVVILFITGGNLAKSFFNDNSLRKVEENLELTKKELNTAILSNNQAQSEIKKLNSQISGYKIRSERLQNEIDIIDLEEEKTRVATHKRLVEIKAIIESKQERIIILKEKDTVFD